MITVITPIFNNEAYIERSVASAHQFDIVQEIIVVDDGSIDNSYGLLLNLKYKYPKLTVLTHPNRQNKGIAKSRNLAIHHSRTDWLSFLDSDDYYLEGRFEKTEEIISSSPQVDGVFEPVVNRVESEIGANRFRKPEKYVDGSIIGIKHSTKYTPFESMFYGKGGVVHLNGLTVKRTLAISVGLFDEGLRIVDDSVFRLKVAYKGKLVPGTTTPVAVRTIHDTNNEPNISQEDILRKYEVLTDFFISLKADKTIRRNSIRRILIAFIHSNNSKSLYLKIFRVVQYIILHPRIVYAYLF